MTGDAPSGGAGDDEFAGNATDDGSATGDDPAAVLRRSRERVGELAAEDGAYRVACARTGVRPEPVAGLAFGSHDDAVAAAETGREYRAALRTLDPEAPAYDLVVTHDDAPGLEVACARERVEGVRPNGLPRARRTATVAGGRDGEWLRVENVPVVHLSRDAGPVDDAAVERQLDAKL